MATSPSGTVTFLFTDVELSTRMWEEHPVEMQLALERHDAILRTAIEDTGGYVFSTAGDAFSAAFARAADAVSAALTAQQALGDEPWPDGTPIRARMGIHTGESHERGGDYFGPAVNRAARIMSVGHGGQVLVSATTAGVIEGTDLVDLGDHRLRDLSAPERLFQVGGGIFPPLRSLDVVRHNLPVERTPLLGRGAEIDKVAELLAAHRLVTLLGIGGTGKSRLATAVAADIADRFTDGVWFVDLVPASGMEQVAESIATAAGLHAGGGRVVDGLARLISDRAMLIVLDNCEHITEDVADLVEALLEQTVAPRFLATSREPLRLIDERQFHLAPLAVANDLLAPAVQLLTATAERVNVTVAPEDVGTAARICRQLDGLPLSVELAAAQLRQLSLTELADRLDRRFDLLSQHRGGRARRQASLAAVLNDSWLMLDAHEQELLLHLAAFPTAFDTSDIEGVTAGSDVGVAARTLGGLVDRGLIAPAEGGRHRLLETVKLFAREQWQQGHEPDQYLDRHTRWIVGHLTAYPTQDRYTSFELTAWANRHYEDHRAVEDRLVGAGRHSDLAVLLATLSYAYTQATAQQASAVIDRIDAYLDRLPLSDHERGLLHLVAGGAGLHCRRPQRIITDSARAVDLLRRHGEAEELAAALIMHSWMIAFADMEAALRLLDEAATIADAAGADAVADLALAYTANHLAVDGRIEEAVASLGQLRGRLERRTFDNASYCSSSVELAAHITLDPRISRAAGVTMLSELERALGRSALHWKEFELNCAASAAAGDIDATRASLAATEAAILDTADDNGLPDLLVPLAALAWALDQLDRARLWLTAVRRSPTPTLHFGTTTIYRQLRNQVGLLDHNPLEEVTIEDIYAEAKDWLATL